MEKINILQPQSIIKYINGYTLTLLLTIVFFVVLYPNVKTFPYSDDWSYIYYLLNNTFELKYIIAQHNDHRIPIQKVLHLLLLNYSGGDFRILVALNVLVISLTSVIWISIYRFFNKQSYLELSFPIILLSFGFNTVVWGFSFQFISSVFFSSLAILFWLNYLRYGNHSIAFAYFCLIFLSLCGGNGLIASTIMGVYFTLFLYLNRNSFKIKSFNIFVICFWIFLVASLWLNFKGSSATNEISDNIFLYIDFLLHIISSYFGIFLSSHSKWVMIVGVLVLTISTVGIIWIYLNKKLKYEKYEFEALFIFLFSTILLLFAITVTRAASQPWFSGLELHYGYLSIPILFIFIIIVSKLIKKMYLLPMLILFIITYVHNYEWRLNSQLVESKKIVKCHNDIISNKDSLLVSRECLRQFYWMEGEEYEIKLSEGVRQLRQMPYFKN